MQRRAGLASPAEDIHSLLDVSALDINVEAPREISVIHRELEGLFAL